jgi:hypothetical protein
MFQVRDSPVLKGSELQSAIPVAIFRLSECGYSSSARKNIYPPTETLKLMSHQGPLGEIPGMRWCGETNRYYTKASSAASFASFHSPCEETLEFSDHMRSLGVTTPESVGKLPVSERFLTTLPLRTRKRGRIQSDDCSICLRSGVDQKLDPRMRFVSLPCKHSFHFYCAAGWLTKFSGSCPICRNPVDTSLAMAASCANSHLY